MSAIDILGLQEACVRELTEEVLPFWITHGFDETHGGMYTALAEDGELLDSDKSIWFQGRAAWTFATAYRTVKQDPTYLAIARSCVAFLKAHAADSDGRFFFRVTQAGEPVIKRSRYVFSELFGVAGMAAYSRASGDAHYLDLAEQLFDQVQQTLATPGILEPKFNPEQRASKGLSLPMILLVVAQELRSARPDGETQYNQYISDTIDEILNTFVDHEHQAIVEQVGLDGSFQYDHFEGRLINPGHGIEALWFILKEARIQQNTEWERQALTLLDWMWKWGWDTEYGGITYFCDVLNKPNYEYWHDMKFWWPQTEAVIAAAYAYAASGQERHAKMFSEAWEYTMQHFPDRVHGEWYGYLHRDGRISTTLKGTMYKGPFHTPRMFIETLEVLRTLA